MRLIQQKLYRLVKRADLESIEKLLVPGNSGFTQMNPNPLTILGVEQKDSDRYVCTNNNIEVLKYRGEDIPGLCDEFTERGVPVFGITGDDLFDEYRIRTSNTKLRLVDTIDWIIKDRSSTYSRPTLCFIAAKGTNYDALAQKPLTVVVNAKYEYTARDFLDVLAETYGLSYAKIRVLNGKLENEIPERADCGIEIVVSGNTLKYDDTQRKFPRDPQLEVLNEIRQSDISIITSWQKDDDVSDKQPTDDPLEMQYNQIAQRKKQPIDNSLTSNLLGDNNSLVKKFGEEGAELIQAYTNNDRTNIIEEAQQVIWVMQMMMVNSNIAWGDLIRDVSNQKTQSLRAKNSTGVITQ
ncbi:phosphoribosyl-ATP diphosphatase [archaeon]|nr:phosphoribosyl-ATP diphosphatase [archaeon]|tara:strand:+ start:1708 stop:2763 length:1056 start_codon:yes stop_codon:yes gene_type:complete